MSATGRGKKRNPDDFYETPAWAVRRFLEKFNPPPGRWLEPGAGTGAIIRAVDDAIAGSVRAARGGGLLVRPIWTAVEKRWELFSGLMPGDRWLRGDFLAWEPPENHYDLAIGNPPYLFAQEFADKCFSLAEVTAFLLRLNFAGSAARQPWFSEDPADIYILPNRPSFTPNGRTDSIEYAWFVWGDGAGVSRDPKVVWLDRTPKSERGGKG